MSDNLEKSRYHRFCTAAACTDTSTPRNHNRDYCNAAETSTSSAYRNQCHGRELPRVCFTIPRQSELRSNSQKSHSPPPVPPPPIYEEKRHNLDAELSRQKGGCAAACAPKCYTCTETVETKTHCVPSVDPNGPSTSRQAYGTALPMPLPAPTPPATQRACCNSCCSAAPTQQPAAREDFYWTHDKLKANSSCKEQLDKCCEDIETIAECGDASKTNDLINEMFLKRLEEIECAGNNDPDLKLITYQEWVEILLRINSIVLRNMEEFEGEIAGRLKTLTRQAFNTETTEVSKYRKDICTLIRFIQKAYAHDCWDVEHLPFYTVNASQILCGVQRQNKRDFETFSPQFHANMKALTIEVANRHDQVKALKERVYCLEEEMQMAQQKIQLKEDVIRELRSDLKNYTAQAVNASSKVQETSTADTTAAEPLSANESTGLNTSDEPGSNSTITDTLKDLDEISNIESFYKCDQVQRERWEQLEVELQLLFVCSNNYPTDNTEREKQRIRDLFQKLHNDCKNAYHELDILRRRMVNLELPMLSKSTISKQDTIVSDSGFDSKPEDDVALECVRNRLSNMQKLAFESQRKAQQLEMQNQEMTNKLKIKEQIYARSEEVLKEIADKLSEETGNPLSYERMYIDNDKANPFTNFLEAMFEDHKREINEMKCRMEDQERKMKEMNYKIQNKCQTVSELETSRTIDSQQIAKFDTIRILDNKSVFNLDTGRGDNNTTTVSLQTNTPTTHATTDITTSRL